MEYMVGALPSFSDAHVLRALFYLSHGVLSRKKLVELLGIGEGSVRTIIGRLSSDKLITSTKQGHKLTESGVSFVEKIEKRFTHPQTVDLGGFVSGLQSLVIFRGVSEMEWDWVGLRDESLKNGADGAVLIKYNTSFSLPNCELKISDYPYVLDVLSQFDIKAKDVVIVSFSDIIHDAEVGALSIALKMNKKSKSSFFSVFNDVSPNI